MKKRAITLVLAVLVAMTLSGIMVTPACAQQDITVSIGDAFLSPQASTTIPIMITNNTATEVGSANITLTYNKNVVFVTAVGNSDFGSDPYFTCVINNTTGTVRMVAWSILPETTPLRFADVTVKAVGEPGDYTPLNLEVTELRDGYGSEIYPREVSNGSVSIVAAAAVPEYNMFGLSALIGLLAIILLVKVRGK